MIQELEQYFQKLQAEGLSHRQKAIISHELEIARGISGEGGHLVTENNQEKPGIQNSNLYRMNDLEQLQILKMQTPDSSTNINSIDELLERDNVREKDGFPRKINVGRLIKPGKGGKEKIIIVPSTVEEKFIHDNSFREEEEGGNGGAGEGEEGEVIGQQPIHSPKGSGPGPGEGEDAAHEMESNAYELGRILTEKFELPNLRDKGAKRSFTRYTYDLTDKNQGFGQYLDKKATLKKVLETNIALGHIPDRTNVDPNRLLVAPNDKIYRILSREKDYESQAMVFFLRDYSGSMDGKPTVLVVSQHVLIYSWLSYQYRNQVETRFVLHDSNAKEVPDFHTYYNSGVAGGTRIASAYHLVNEIVEKENLARNYNIYIFHGTDGDDWDSEGNNSIPELKKMLAYASRIGITVAKHPSASTTQVERYLTKSNLLTEHPDLLRMDVIDEGVDEGRLIEGIKKLISQENRKSR